jgi:hypothetical protein
MNVFTAQQIDELSARGLSPSDVAVQIFRFTQEVIPVKLERTCVLGDGIHHLSASDCLKYLNLYQNDLGALTISKFVPASGAASRMFKHLYNYSPELLSDLAEEFILQFDRFPFIESLRKRLLEQDIDLNEWRKNNEWEKIFNAILFEQGLNYSNYPKGLVEFHKHDERKLYCI